MNISSRLFRARRLLSSGTEPDRASHAKNGKLVVTTEVYAYYCASGKIQETPNSNSKLLLPSRKNPIFQKRLYSQMHRKDRQMHHGRKPKDHQSDTLEIPVSITLPSIIFLPRVGNKRNTQAI